MPLLTTSELVDLVNQELTVGCMLPKILPDIEIERIIRQRALPWFYRNYRYGVSKTYYLVTKDAFTVDENTGYRGIILPCDIVNVTWIYPTDDKRLFQLGLNAPNLTINFGVTNQPYLSSAITTIGELGVYKVVMDGFADMLNQLSKTTFKYHYNQNNNRLHLLTAMDDFYTSLVLETYVAIEQDAMFGDELFQRYVVAYSKQQLANLLGRYNFNLPGGIQINVSDIQTQAERELTEVKEEINKMTNTSFFRTMKR